MATTKTHAEPQSKTSPTTSPTQQPALPQKQVGSLRPGTVQRAAAAPPPDDPSAVIEPGLGGAGRAHAMRALQGSMGNARLSRALDSTTPRIQRACACGGQAGPNGECAACKARREQVQRQTDTPDAPDALPSSVTSAIQSGGGQPLDRATRARMEPAFGADFGGVRVHTGASADRAARDINAKAFTAGQNIFFAAGQHQPGTQEGDKLLAHELTHTVQQGSDAGTPQAAGAISQPGEPDEREAEKTAGEVVSGRQVVPVPSTTPAGQVQRDGSPPSPVPAPAAPVNDDVVKESVNVIMKALSGITFGGDSAKILAQFQKSDARTARAIIQSLKSRSSEKGKGPDEIIDWMFEKMTAEDSRSLRHLFIGLGMVDDVGRIVAMQVKKQLEKWFTSGEEILMALSEFVGAKLDAVLDKLQGLIGLKPEALAAKLFGDMDRVNAERLRQHFFKGGPTALTYAATWTASKIHSLLKGYVSHADSSQVLWNIDSTPIEYRVVVQQRLDTLTWASFNMSAADSLMHYLDKSDYEALIQKGGLQLKAWEDKRSGLRKVVGVLEWGAVFLAWVACGVIGIVTGILSSIWDIIKGIWDIGVAIWNLIWSFIYLISGGAAGSENWLAVKEFFAGLKALGTPGKLWEQYWEGLKLEFKTIEGPLTQCRVAELGVRRFINAFVNILLIFFAGYGLVKIGVKAVQSVAELAALAREVGILEALIQTGVRVGRATRKLVSVTLPGELAKLADMLKHPVGTLVRAGRQINLILLATREEGVWAFMRNRSGALLESEKKFWQEQKETWRARAENHQTRHAELGDEAASFEHNLEDSKAPENPEDTARRLTDDAKKLEDKVDDLSKDVTEPERGPAPTNEVGMDRATKEIRHAICGFCFPAGTKVLTPQGYTNIEELHPGDLVLARDEARQGDPSYRRILQAFQNITDSLVEVTIGTQLIRSTPGHVWWVAHKGWILARDLAAGDSVAAADGELLTVMAVRQVAEFAITYNFEVEEFHTYYVAGETGAPAIWVHNQSLGVRVLRPDQTYQLILPKIVITDPDAIRGVIRNSLEATGSYSTELGGLYSFLRQGGGAGFQGVTADAINQLEVVLANINQKGGGVVAAIDLERIGARRVYELTNPEVMNRLMVAYPKGAGNMESAWLDMASEGVVAVRGKIPARAVQSLVKIPPDLSTAEKEAILKELLKPCKL